MTIDQMVLIRVMQLRLMQVICLFQFSLLMVATATLLTAHAYEGIRIGKWNLEMYRNKYCHVYADVLFL